MGGDYNMIKIKGFVANSYRLLKWLCAFLEDGVFCSLQNNNKNEKGKKNTDVFILGNGPSLIQDIESHIDNLKTFDVMMVNQALTSDIAFSIRPKYYMLMDALYWTTKYDPTIDKEYLLWWKGEIKKLESAFLNIDWHMTLFVPHQVYMLRDEHAIEINNPWVKICEFNLISLHTFSKLEKIIFSNNMGVPSHNNVLISAICCCLSMKYQNVYLVGADSNWHIQINVDKNNRVFFNEKHFYRKCDKKNYSHHSVSIHFRTIYDVLSAYDRLSSLGFHIYNLSSHSMIDAFPRDTLENVLAKENVGENSSS